MLFHGELAFRFIATALERDLAEVGLEPHGSHPDLFEWDEPLTAAQMTLALRAVELVLGAP